MFSSETFAPLGSVKCHSSKLAFWFLSAATQAVGELQNNNNMVHLNQTELLEKLKVKAKQLQQYQVIIWHQSVQHNQMVMGSNLYLNLE